MSDDRAGRSAFLAAICTEVDEDLHRLVYADWLVETDPGYRLSDYRSWFIRWQINGDDRGDKHPGCPYNLGWFVDKRHLWGADRLSRTVYGMGGNARPEDPKYGSYSWNTFPDRSIWTQTGDVELTYRRGFVEEVKCTAEAFGAHADELIWNPSRTAVCPLSAQPVTKVVLTTPPADLSQLADQFPSVKFWVV